MGKARPHSTRKDRPKNTRMPSGIHFASKKQKSCSWRPGAAVLEEAVAAVVEEAVVTGGRDGGSDNNWKVNKNHKQKRGEDFSVVILSGTEKTNDVMKSIIFCIFLMVEIK